MRILLPVVAALSLSAATTAQRDHDTRDVVETTAGKELRGRVVQRFDPKEVLLLQGGKRVRIPKRKVAKLTTVNDHLRQFFAHRHNARRVVNREWLLVEWAVSKKLDTMARLQALHIVVEYGNHEGAHEFLGHKKVDGTWRWPSGSTWLSREAWEEYVGEWGHPLELEGEHFLVRTNAGLRRGLDALFDLERMYVWWFETFGEALRPREVLVPMNYHVYKSIDDFPAWTSNKYPYYFPQPNGDVSYTYVPEDTAIPDLLFQLGAEQLLYNAHSDGAGAQLDPRDRIAAWIDIGLGQWVHRSFLGDPGYAEPVKPALDRNHGLAVLRSKRYGLENMLGLRYSRFHDVTGQTELHWAVAATFVAFLMEDGARSNRLLEYIDLAYNQTKGNSSSMFDRVFKTRIERLEKTWLSWLEGKIGVKASRR